LGNVKVPLKQPHFGADRDYLFFGCGKCTSVETRAKELAVANRC